MSRINSELETIIDMMNADAKNPKWRKQKEISLRLNKLKEHGKRLIESMTMKGNP
jgi:hypothetical protein